MTKTTIFEELAYELGLRKNEAKQIVDMTFKLMADALIKGEDVNISDFASFRIKERPSKRYRNTSTGKMMEKKSGRRVKVRMSANLMRKIDPGFDEKMEVEE